MHIKIKQDYEALINEIIKEETHGFVIPTPSQVVHGILEKVKKDREKNSQIVQDEDYEDLDVDEILGRK